jgi:hypothetical protein
MGLVDFLIKKHKKMDISKKLTQILLEQGASKETKGVNVSDTGTVLQNTINFCSGISFLKGKAIKSMSKTSPKDNTSGQPLMAKFKDVYNSGKEKVAFASGDDGSGNIIVVFGMQDPNLTDRALLGYRVTTGAVPDRITDGIGKNCQYLQKIEDVGQVQLSDYDQSRLDAFIASKKGLFVSTDPKDSLNYRIYLMKDLKDADRKPLLQNPGEGIVWKKVEQDQGTMGDVAGEVDDFMKDQGFTKNKPKAGTYEEANYGFYLKDVIDDLPSLSIDPDIRTTGIYFPDPNYTSEYGGSVLTPDRKTCKSVIKRLYDCKTKTNKAGCSANLFRDKFIALSCGDKKFIEGPFGKGDEYKEIFSDPGPYGLAKLNRARGKAKYSSITESLNKKINKRLNEDFKRLSFNKKKIKFDNQLVESLADQLVVSALFDLQKDFKKFQRLDENQITDFLSSAGSKALEGGKNLVGNLGSKLGTGLTQGFKETIAKKIIKWAGFNPNGYFALLIANIFANLDFKDYMNFVSDCEKFSDVITKSALEAWLDKAVASMKGMDGETISTFVYTALKNTVTEALANTPAFKTLENMATKIVCGIIEGVRDSGIIGSLF